MFCNLCRLILVGLSVVFIATPLLAQGTSTKFGPEINGHIGTLLPNQIPGVTEILPCWGLRYSHPIGGALLEAGYRNTHAKGVDFDLMSIGLRLDMNTIEGFTNIFYGGYDMTSYIPATQTARTWKGGGHLGSGLMMHVASSFWIRTDLSFHVSPGTSLYLGLGFVIRTPGGN
jgi:hypothetical protein